MWKVAVCLGGLVLDFRHRSSFLLLFLSGGDLLLLQVLAWGRKTNAQPQLGRQVAC